MSVELPHLPKVQRRTYVRRAPHNYPPDSSLPLLKRAAIILDFGRHIQRHPTVDAEVILTMVTAWLAEHGHQDASEFMIMEVLGMAVELESD